jgi:hypothetical protein
MLMAALETEAADYVERHRHERDTADGRWWSATAGARGAS